MVPLDELELKLGLLSQMTDLTSITTTQICKELYANFELEVTEEDIHLVFEPSVLTSIDQAIITYKNLI